MALKLRKTVATTKTWNARKGTCTEYRYETNPMGKRIVALRWHDTGEVEMKAVQGDGRNKRDFITFAKITFPKGWDIDAAVAAMARQAFGVEEG